MRLSVVPELDQSDAYLGRCLNDAAVTCLSPYVRDGVRSLSPGFSGPSLFHKFVVLLTMTNGAKHFA